MKLKCLELGANGIGCHYAGHLSGPAQHISLGAIIRGKGGTSRT